MEPYGPNEQQRIGLFTFYRQQAELQNQLKQKIKAQNLNKILKKVTRNTQNEIKNQSQVQEMIKQRLPNTQRRSQKLRQVTEQNSLPQTKRTQLLINKSVMEINQQKKQQKLSNKRQKTQNTTYKQPSNKDKDKQTNDSLQQYKQFSKYLSQLDMIRSSKKQKSKVIVDKSYQYKSNLQLYQKKRVRNDIQDQNRISVQFKKLALQPQQFGLGELNNSFVPISIHKKQKTGLKSYKRQKQQILQKQKLYKQQQQQQSSIIVRRTNQPKQRININNLSPKTASITNTQNVLQSLLQKYENKINPKSKKLISVHRLSAKVGQNKSNNVNNNKQALTEQMRNDNNYNSNIKSQSLPRLKTNLKQAQVINNIKSNNLDINNNNNNSNSNGKQKSNSMIMAMSLQLQRSHQLRSKYQIKQVQRQDQSILSLNKKIRNEIKKVKNQSQHQVRHYLSMKHSDKQFYSLKSNNNSRDQNVSMLNKAQQQPIAFINKQKNANYISSKEIFQTKKNSTKQNSINKSLHERNSPSIQRLNSQQFTFKKHKEMFCKRDQYLKNYKQKLKTNIFRIQKSQQSKIKSLMENKKQQIIDNLITKLNIF